MADDTDRLDSPVDIDEFQFNPSDWMVLDDDDLLIEDESNKTIQHTSKKETFNTKTVLKTQTKVASSCTKQKDGSSVSSTRSKSTRVLESERQKVDPGKRRSQETRKLTSSVQNMALTMDYSHNKNEKTKECRREGYNLKSVSDVPIAVAKSLTMKSSKREIASFDPGKSRSPEIKKGTLSVQNHASQTQGKKDCGKKPEIVNIQVGSEARTMITTSATKISPKSSTGTSLIASKCKHDNAHSLPIPSKIAKSNKEVLVIDYSLNMSSIASLSPSTKTSQRPDDPGNQKPMRKESVIQCVKTTPVKEHIKGTKSKSIKYDTDSQTGLESIAEAMAVNLSENKTTKIAVIDEDFGDARSTVCSISRSLPAKSNQQGSSKPSAELAKQLIQQQHKRSDESASQKTSAVSLTKANCTKSDLQGVNNKQNVVSASNLSPLQLKETESIVSQNSMEDESKQKHFEKVKNVSDNSTLSNLAPKKRVIRRFHRTTQTSSSQQSNKLIQTSFKSPSIDPKKFSSDVGQQTVNNETSVLDYFSSGAVGVKPFTVDRDVFQEAITFCSDKAVTRKHDKDGRKYGIRLCPIVANDVDKASPILNKTDSYTLCFLSKDFGILDLFFQEEEDFISVINHIRKNRTRQRHLCMSIIKPVGRDSKKHKNHALQLNATIVFDQNFSTSGYLAQSKSPAWNKPKSDVTVSVHNVPKGMPLSFLNLVFPDALSVEMDDPDVKVTSMTSSRVKLGMARKSVDPFLCLFAQVIVNNTPLMLTTGLTREEDVVEMKGIILQRRTIVDHMKVESSYPTLVGVPRDILAKKRTKPILKAEEPDIVMEVEDVECIEKVLRGRPRAWKGYQGTDNLHQIKAQIQQSQVNAESGDLSDISDNSDFGGEETAQKDPDLLNKWRHTEPLSLFKVHHAERDPSFSDERIVDRSRDRKRSPLRGDTRYHHKAYRGSTSDVRDEGLSHHSESRSASATRFAQDSQRTVGDHSRDETVLVGRMDEDKKWPDLNDKDFDQRHKVILPQKAGRDMSSEEGDLRSMLDSLKNQRSSVEMIQRTSLERGSMERDRRRFKSRSPSERPRLRNMRDGGTRSPNRIDRDRRIVRKSISPQNKRLISLKRKMPTSPRLRRSISPRCKRSISPRHRRSILPRHRRSPDLHVRPRQRRLELSSPPRKIGVTAKDLEKKADLKSNVHKETESWRTLWKNENDKEKTSSQRKPHATQADDIGKSKMLFNTLMEDLKEKAEVYEKSKDKSLVEAAQVYSQINKLAETLTAIKNEQEVKKTSQQSLESESHNQKFKDDKSCTFIEKAQLHPDLLRYVKKGSTPSKSPPLISPPVLPPPILPVVLPPPPIPPPVAPPLFSNSSQSGSNKVKLEEIAKQLATEILSNKPDSQGSLSGGTWMVPPSEEVKNLSSIHGRNRDIQPGNPQTSQPLMFCPPHNPIGPNIPPMNPMVPPGGPVFSVPPPGIVSISSIARGGMMNPPTGMQPMPQGMWNQMPPFSRPPF